MLIENNDSGSAYLPQVAVDAAGNAIAVWHQSDGANMNIWANRYVNGSGWGNAELIETNDSASAAEPQLAMNRAGNAMAIWYQYDGSLCNISANRYEVGSGWGTADLIVTNSLGLIQHPRVVIDDSGNAIAVWPQYHGMQFSIFVDRYVVGAGWGTVGLVETDDLHDAISPTVAVDGEGNAFALWVQENSTNTSIWASRYVVGIGWGASELIETNDSGYAGEPQIATDPAGNAIAVWPHNYDVSSNSTIWTNRYVAGSGWGVAEMVEADDSLSASSPQVAVDTAGNAIAVWSQYDGFRFNTSSSRYVVNVGWGTPQLIGTNDSAIPTSPQVAVDASGNAITIWSQFDWTHWTIWTNRYVVDSGWGIAEMIETNNSEPATSPQIAVDPMGNAYAVWGQHDGIRENIWAARYVASEPAPIPEFGSMPFVAILLLVAIATIGQLRRRKAQ